MALISPNLTALISRWGAERAGTALGLQTAANSLGQAGGPIVGSFLFVWQPSVPYAFAGMLMFGIGVVTARMKGLIPSPQSRGRAVVTLQPR